eukprot:1445388-Rhodomonas_salina.1
MSDIALQSLSPPALRMMARSLLVADRRVFVVFDCAVQVGIILEIARLLASGSNPYGISGTDIAASPHPIGCPALTLPLRKTCLRDFLR